MASERITTPPTTPPQAPPWLLATAADLADLNIEAPIRELLTADIGELSHAFEMATRSTEMGANPLETPAGRVFVMLSAVTGMQFKPHERNEPFGPLASMSDGRRTAIPEDFRSSHVDLLAGLAERANNPVLRARLADVCWLLDRKRWALGRTAVAAYTGVVQKVADGALVLPSGRHDGALHHTARGLLQRALYIGLSIGWDKPEALRTREAAIALRQHAIKSRAAIPANWFSKLDLDFGLSDPEEVARGLDDLLAAVSADVSSDVLVGLWGLASDAYRLAKKDDEKYRCQSEGAEALVVAAEDALAKQQSAMVAAHRLSAAIAQLHGIPGKKDRRKELQHRLIDIQAGIREEMLPISQILDLREFVEGAEEALKEGTLLDKLFVFANAARSPDPEALVRDACELIREHPLSSLFATSHHDREGKVIYRSEGGGFGTGENAAAIQQQIAQAESLRRTIACAAIETGRVTIVAQHFLSDEVFLSLLQNSPFVPHHLLATFSRGFLRFFQGDLTSALYVLTPLLENSLRDVLRLNGYDVTVFDDATQTQRDRTVSQLFEQMRTELDGIFGEAITTDIENIFLKQPGPHIRHALSHGLLHDGIPYGTDAIYACWLIFRLCLLPLFGHRDTLQFPFE